MALFGTWRFVLAILVVLAHMSSEHGRWAWVGAYAVQAFFVLSGYLMTLILQEKYGFTLSGLGSYLLNRFLRIFPSYYAAIGFTMVCLAVFGVETVEQHHPRMRWPHSWSEWWPNFTIIGLTNTHPARFVPQAWALDIELVFYLLIALILGRSRSIGLIWLALSILYLMLSPAEEGAKFPLFRYFEKSLPFAVGSMVYHARQWPRRWISPQGWFIPGCLAVWSVPYISNGLEWTSPYSKMLYIHLAATAAVVWGLSEIRAAKNSLGARLDKQCGDLSYPTYLLHWQCAIVCIEWFAIPQAGGVTFLVVTLATVLVAKLEVLCLSGPIENYRHRRTLISSLPRIEPVSQS